MFYPLDYERFYLLCSRQESNLDHKIRNLAFYPLNYGSSCSFVSQTEHLRDVVSEVRLLLLLFDDAPQVVAHIARAI